MSELNIEIKDRPEGGFTICSTIPKRLRGMTVRAEDSAEAIRMIEDIFTIWERSQIDTWENRNV